MNGDKAIVNCFVLDRNINILIATNYLILSVAQMMSNSLYGFSSNLRVDLVDLLYNLRTPLGMSLDICLGLDLVFLICF